MKLKLGMTAAVALLVLPSAALAQTPSTSANTRAMVKICMNTKAKMGARNFNALFAPRTHNARVALRNCARREAAAQAQARVNAAETCRTLQADASAFAEFVKGTPNEGKTFAEVFGTAPNAYGRCVSFVARAQNRARRAALVNAAQTCRTFQTDAAAFAEFVKGTPNEGKTFAEVFGTAPNAYGKCVSFVARMMNPAEADNPTP